MGRVTAEFEEAVEGLAALDAGRRIWARDSTLWTESGEEAWLAWLDAPLQAARWIRDTSELREEAQRAGVKDVVLLGMGGSSLCPEMLSITFPADATPHLSILDSTVPDQVLAVDRGIDLRKTWFIVASKSGSTTEPNVLLDYFYHRTEGDGSKFIAITDPGSSLEAVSIERNFRYVFHGIPEIGGRFSALSAFGLVPAALAGLDLARFLESAASMQAECAPHVPVESNPGLVLGAAIAAASKAGCDKMTFLISQALSRLGGWVEQLIAESTGKDGVGICPVVEEPGRAPECYLPDRIFVFVLVGNDSRLSAQARELEAEGHPVIRVFLDEVWDLSGELFRWEVATAAASVLLGVNPFDQPDVQQSKDLTARTISDFVASGRFPEEQPIASDAYLKLYSTGTPASSVGECLGKLFTQTPHMGYVALSAFIDTQPFAEEALQRIRQLLGHRLGVATTMGFGPRFLHSTGQLHKGGPGNGIFLHITCDPIDDVQVPQAGYSLGNLSLSQALGDVKALEGRNRPVLRCHLSDLRGGLDHLEQMLRRFLPPR